jgi:hypothetical protein
MPASKPPPSKRDVQVHHDVESDRTVDVSRDTELQVYWDHDDAHQTYRIDRGDRALRYAEPEG